MYRVDVFVQQLNFAETIRLLESPARQAFRHGSHLAEKSYLAGKATTFSPPGYSPGGDFNLETEAKGVAL
jgi:hypothetical protein